MNNELTAALATIEKCREITNCPGEVDLQDWVKQLAAENVAMKQAAEFATAPDMWIEQADGILDYRYCDWYVDVLKAAMEAPATSAYLAGIKADGVEDEPFGFVSRNGDVVVIELNGDRHIRDGMPVFVKELREGADK